MFTLFRRDYYAHNWVTYFSLAIGLIIFYTINFPPVFLFTIFFLSLMITLFYYDDKNKTSRFFVSLPLSKERFVRSRYLYLAGLSMVLLLFQWLVGLVVSQFSIFSSIYVFHWHDIIVLYTIAFVIIAVGGVIFYLLRSFMLATSIILLLYLICTFLLLDPLVNVLGMTEYIYFNKMDHGFALLVEKYIPFQPYLVLIVAAPIFLYISMKLTEWIFLKRNL